MLKGAWKRKGALNPDTQEEPRSSSGSAGCQKIRNWLFQVSKFSICPVSGTPFPLQPTGRSRMQSCLEASVSAPLHFLMKETEQNILHLRPKKLRLPGTSSYSFFTCWLVSINAIRLFQPILKVRIFFAFSFSMTIPERAKFSPVWKKQPALDTRLSLPPSSYSYTFLTWSEAGFLQNGNNWLI